MFPAKFYNVLMHGIAFAAVFTAFQTSAGLYFG
jgi:hypothetical protein